MKNKILIILILISWLGFFILPTTVLAAENDIIISEIAAFESSNYEWLEIFNNGDEAVDLTGWKFYENETNHKLTEYQLYALYY